MNHYRQRLIHLAIAVLSADAEQSTQLANDAIDLITNELDNPAAPPIQAPPSGFYRQPSDAGTWLDSAPVQILPTPVGDLPHYQCPVCAQWRPRPHFIFRNALRIKCTTCYRDSRRRSMATHSRPQISLPGLSSVRHP
jgi:hypothetical protein